MLRSDDSGATSGPSIIGLETRLGVRAASLVVFGALLTVLGLFLPWWDYVGHIGFGLPPSGDGMSAPAGPVILVLSSAIGFVAWRALRNGGASPHRIGLIALATGVVCLVTLDTALGLLPQGGEPGRIRVGFPHFGFFVSLVGAVSAAVASFAVRSATRGLRSSVASVSAALLLAALVYWLVLPELPAPVRVAHATSTLAVLAALGVGLRLRLPLTAVRPSSVGLLLLGVGVAGIVAGFDPQSLGVILAVVGGASIVGARLLDLPIGSLGPASGRTGRRRLLLASAALLAFALALDAADAVRGVLVSGASPIVAGVRLADALLLAISVAVLAGVVARLLAMRRQTVQLGVAADDAAI